MTAKPTTPNNWTEVDKIATMSRIAIIEHDGQVFRVRMRSSKGKDWTIASGGTYSEVERIGIAFTDTSL